MGEGRLRVLLVIALVFGIVCFEAWIGMLLFNWLMGLFGCAFSLTFWQALGVVWAPAQLCRWFFQNKF